MKKKSCRSVHFLFLFLFGVEDDEEEEDELRSRVFGWKCFHFLLLFLVSEDILMHILDISLDLFMVILTQIRKIIAIMCHAQKIFPPFLFRSVHNC